MTRIRVLGTGEVFNAWKRPMNETVFPGEWETDTGIYTPEQAQEIVSHRGEYNPDHVGEVNPDWWDRKGYDDPNVGRHLLHTGVE